MLNRRILIWKFLGLELLSHGLDFRVILHFYIPTTDVSTVVLMLIADMAYDFLNKIT